MSQPSASSGPGRPARNGGGPGNRRARAHRDPVLPYLIVLAGCGAGLAWISQGGVDSVRRGTLAVAGAMFAAALARLVLPENRIGMLASRKRLTDVATLAALAAGLLAAGLVVPAP